MKWISQKGLRQKKKKSLHRIKFRGFLLLLLVFCGIGIADIHASAKTASLPQIETLLQQGKNYQILEIIPEEDSGEIGFYIDGQEPIADYLQILQSTQGKQAREQFINTTFQKLQEENILGKKGQTDTPISNLYDTFYEEYTYWEKEPAALASDTQLQLEKAEQQTIQGSMVKTENGAYRAVRTYEIAPNQDGDFVQNISYFIYDTAEPSDANLAGSDKTYYYAPTFSKVEGAATDLLEQQTAMYRLEEDGKYVYVGHLGKEEFDGLDAAQEYYFVTETGAAYDSYAPEHPYAAKADGFQAQENGTFHSSETGLYELVVAGGDYSLSTKGNDSVTIQYDKVWIQCGYQSQNWFWKFVLDQTDTAQSTSALKLTVNSKTANTVTEQDVQSANMIVFSQGRFGTYTTENDIAESVGAALQTKLQAMQTPCVVEEALLSEDASLQITSAANAILQIAGLEQQGVAKCIYRMGTYQTVQQQQVSRLLTPYLTKKMQSTVGYEPVLEEIRQQNFLRSLEQYEVEALPEQVTLATVLRHIMNYVASTQFAKETLQVLELQPASEYQLTPEIVAGWLKEDTIAPEQIQMKQMAISEFVGHIEDLSENYDMIYIGDVKQTGNASIYTADSTMKTLIYYNIGSTYRTNNELTGLLDRDYTTADRTEINLGDGTQANLFRFPSNDITKSKREALHQYAAAGYPIVLADTLVQTENGPTAASGIAADKIDRNSYLYQVLESVKNARNVMSVTEVQKNPERLMEYLTLSKPMLEMLEQPTVYEDGAASDGDETSAPTAMTANADGEYFLNYEFVIHNPTDATPATTTYHCQLYVDINADGRYEAGEELKDIQIFENNVLLKPDAAQQYALFADHTYELKRQVPTEMVGIIPWRIVVTKNGASQIHTSATNYTRIAAKENEKQTIRVLQIDVKEHQAKGCINLETNQTYQTLFAQLQDFDVVREYVPCTDSISYQGQDLQLDDPDLSAQTLCDAFNQYDMLIIGFDDMYDGVKTKAFADAIIKYIDMGKSILFTHDTTSIVNVSDEVSNRGTVLGGIRNPWGYYFNTIIRDKVGMDLYGITSVQPEIKALMRQGTPLTEAQKAQVQNAGYRIAYAPNGTETVPEIQGYTNFSLLYFSSRAGWQWGGDKQMVTRTTKVSQVNTGQITTYPFNINQDNLTVAKTHHQYYEVNLESDDIVVWYCLAPQSNGNDGRAYREIQNDTRNQYYIYSKGNVTYSGVGHSISSVPEEEAKLFINTMIASYRASLQVPSVKITSDSNGKTEITDQYYTSENWGAQGELIDLQQYPLYFSIIDPNLTTAKKTLQVSAFYTVNTIQDGENPAAAENQKQIPMQLEKGTNGYTAGKVEKILLNLSGANGELSPLAALQQPTTASITITITATEQVEGHTPMTVSNTVNLRKVGLFDLR